MASGAKLPSVGLWLNASKPESVLEAGTRGGFYARIHVSVEQYGGESLDGFWRLSERLHADDLNGDGVL